jgi:hypothetical protein
MSAAAETVIRPVPVRRRIVVASSANGQPRTFRLAPTESQHAAYRRLALAILALDVATLTDEVRTARRRVLPRAA